MNDVGNPNAKEIVDITNVAVDSWWQGEREENQGSVGWKVLWYLDQKGYDIVKREGSKDRKIPRNWKWRSKRK